MNIGSVSEKLKQLSDSQSYLIAYSGGVDSHVLLHGLAMLCKQSSSMRLRAIHVHHGVSASADKWALHCQQVCEMLNIPFLCSRVRIQSSGDSWEASARNERYRVLAENLQEEECLLTAHTQDDQAETILLQLLRGAGPKGLAAMPEKKSLAHSLHLRPLLQITRDDIVAYAKAHELLWVEDESNENLRFDRNYLRHYIMPLLKRRWPGAARSMSRSAIHCGDATQLLADVAEQDLLDVQGSVFNTLSITALLALSAQRRANVLRHWFLESAERAPDTQRLKQLENDVLRCGRDANPIFPLEQHTLRRYRDDLYLVNNLAIESDFEMQWDCRSTLKLPGNLGELSPQDFADFSQLTVRFRRGGESIKPAGSAYTQSLKKLFQQWGVPSWERDRIPLVFDQGRLVAVIGYCYAE